MVTWGGARYANFGGDSSKVQEQLVGVQRICAAETAFAALKVPVDVIGWIWPPHSNSGESRFIGIPYYKCNNHGGHCYCEGATPKLLVDILNVLKKEQVVLLESLTY